MPLARLIRKTGRLFVTAAVVPIVLWVGLRVIDTIFEREIARKKVQDEELTTDEKISMLGPITRLRVRKLVREDREELEDAQPLFAGESVNG